MSYYSLFYSLKVWLSSVLLAPIIFIIKNCCFNGLPADPESIAQVYFIMAIISGILSFITWLTFWGITVITGRYFANMLQRKLILSFAGIFLTITTFVLIFTSDYASPFSGLPLDVMLSNCFCIGAFCWLYKLQTPVIS
ncbi:MAG: hypothetical protein ACXVB0_22030 [Mucilaginibacter sp.]